MLAAKAQYSLADAKRYFKEHLSVGDYYAEGQHVAGQWFGKGAADLGLQGVTTMEQFERLCENLHPATGQKLTLRQNATSIETGKDGVTHETANRRVFYDFTLSPPKSVSIAALVCDDKRIVAAHGQAIRVAMNELQSFAATRVRKNGQCTDRTMGNVVAAVFQHDTSRALDPHLHSHCIVFNATYDGAEKQWKALQNHDMLAAQKFVDNVYYHELARELVKCGYQIENKPRGDFEIRGISQELIDKFSKRRNQIDEKVRELLEREPEKANGNLAAIRENIAHKERPPKVRDMALSRLQTMWNDQMTAGERDSLRTLTTGRKLANGELVTVKETRPGGRIVLTDGRALGENFRQFVHGYAVTSYASQGKSVDYVLFSDSTVKAATNNQQWYVTISRGKKGIHIFTGDKEQLRDNIMRSGDRPLALDTVTGKGDSRTVAVRRIQAFLRERASQQEAENRRKSRSLQMGM